MISIIIEVVPNSVIKYIITVYIIIVIIFCFLFSNKSNKQVMF